MNSIIIMLKVHAIKVICKKLSHEDFKAIRFSYLKISIVMIGITRYVQNDKLSNCYSKNHKMRYHKLSKIQES